MRRFAPQRLFFTGKGVGDLNFFTGLCGQTQFKIGLAGFAHQTNLEFYLRDRFHRR
ncbi:MAG: hypothetical protein ACK48D_25685 [Pseudanabaena sp.]